MLRFNGSLAIDGSAWDRESEAAFALTRALAVKPSPFALDASRPSGQALAPSSRESAVGFSDGGDAGAGATTAAARCL